MGITLDCSFLRTVFIHDTVQPSIELSTLQMSFKIGQFAPVQLVYLVLANSYEVEFYIDNSQMLKHYKSFLLSSPSQFVHYLQYAQLHCVIVRKYLTSHHTETYANFTSGVVLLMGNYA